MKMSTVALAVMMMMMGNTENRSICNHCYSTKRLFIGSLAKLESSRESLKA